MNPRMSRRYVRVVTWAFGVAALAVSVAGPARAIVYHGAPDLPLAVAVVQAGGGAKAFSSQALFKELTGPLAAAETAKLQAQFGNAKVTNAFAVFDYAIDDTLRILTKAKVALPAPDVKAGDGRALATQLYAAGQTPGGKWDVGYMLERLVSHPVHHVIMKDIDSRFTPAVNASFHVVLAQMMQDLAVAYAPGHAAAGASSAAAGATPPAASAAPASSASP